MARIEDWRETYDASFPPDAARYDAPRIGYRGSAAGSEAEERVEGQTASGGARNQLIGLPSMPPTLVVDRAIGSAA